MGASQDGQRPDSSSRDDSTKAGDDAVDFAQAYRDLARGEQVASALEADLLALEGKIDGILAGLAENTAKGVKAPLHDKSSNSSHDGRVEEIKGQEQEQQSGQQSDPTPQQEEGGEKS